MTAITAMSNLRTSMPTATGSPGVEAAVGDSDEVTWADRENAIARICGAGMGVASLGLGGMAISQFRGSIRYGDGLGWAAAFGATAVLAGFGAAFGLMYNATPSGG